jgi:hypothetical protein
LRKFQIVFLILSGIADLFSTINSNYFPLSELIRAGDGGTRSKPDRPTTFNPAFNIAIDRTIISRRDIATRYRVTIWLISVSKPAQTGTKHHELF